MIFALEEGREKETDMKREEVVRKDGGNKKIKTYITH